MFQLLRSSTSHGQGFGVGDSNGHVHQVVMAVTVTAMHGGTHLCPEMHLTLIVGTLYKTDVFVVFI